MKYQVLVSNSVFFATDNELEAHECARLYREIGWKHVSVRVLVALEAYRTVTLEISDGDKKAQYTITQTDLERLAGEAATLTVTPLPLPEDFSPVPVMPDGTEIYYGCLCDKDCKYKICL